MRREINVRSARSEDCEQLRVLLEELDAFHRAGAPWLLQPPQHEARGPETLEAMLRDPKRAVFVADPGECIGVATVGLRGAPEHPAFIPQVHAVIDDLAVRKDWRRSGVGKRLFDACESWAREHGARWLEVNVYEFNHEASDFYSRLGLETTMRKMRRPI